MEKNKYNKKISIIIPTYNRINELKECIDSILNQSYNNFEIIIVDDCSKCDVKKELDKIYNDDRIYFFQNEENGGAGTSRHNGYLKATGDYIIFCDDDDYYIDNDWFKNAVQIFENEEINLICSNSIIKYEKENKTIVSKLNFESMIDAKEYLKKFQYGYQKPNSTFPTMFRKTILDKSDLKNMKMVNDSSIYLRSLIGEGKVYVYEKPVGVYRIHSKNITFNIKADFLIANLEEKKYIYDKICEQKLISDVNLWLENQTMLTANYFITGTLPTKEERNKVYNWIKNNLKNYKKMLLKLELLYIKSKMKSKIKRRK